MRTQLAFLFAAAVLLSACSKEAQPPAPQAAASAPLPAAQSQQVSIDTITAETQGFTVGPTMSARTVYVFFDAQCPHCAEMWEAAKPMKGQARFVWMPVGLLGDKSFSQGAAILNAADPVAAMEQNEASVRARTGGISAMGVPDAQLQAVKANTKLFTEFGFNGVPTLVGKNATTGQVVTIDGAIGAQGLAQRLGWSAPAS
jgi:thiol:disulfide interchange protein DsbG